MRLINEPLRDCHCLHLRDRPATISLPFEESGSFRDRSELAAAIHASREARSPRTRLFALPWTSVTSDRRCSSFRTLGSEIRRRAKRGTRRLQDRRIEGPSTHSRCDGLAGLFISTHVRHTNPQHRGSRCYYFFFLFKPITLRGNRYEST